MVKVHFAPGLHSLQYKAENLGWSSSLLLQTEAALIRNYGREQTDYRYVLYMNPLQQTQTIPLSVQKYGCCTCLEPVIAAKKTESLTELLKLITSCVSFFNDNVPAVHVNLYVC